MGTKECWAISNNLLTNRYKKIEVVGAPIKSIGIVTKRVFIIISTGWIRLPVKIVNDVAE